MIMSYSIAICFPVILFYKDNHKIQSRNYKIPPNELN